MSVEYDPSGFISSYLFLSFLLPLTIIFIFYSKKGVPNLNCKCKLCSKRIKESRYKNKKFIFPLVLICFILIKNILTLKFTGKTSFNPYEVLEIDDTVDMKGIKKAYRKLMRKYDPDLAPEDKKEEMDQMSLLVNKAYQMLTNDKTVEEDDHEKEEIIAIPRYLKNYGNFVLILYVLILGVYIPFVAYKKWHKSQKYNKLGVSYQTMEYFYKKLTDEIENTPIMTRKSLINILCESPEYSIFYKKYKVPKDLKTQIESKYAVPIKDTDKISVPYAILTDHLFRTGYFNDSNFIKITLQLLNGMKKVAASKKRKILLIEILNLEKMIIQKVFDPNFSDLQFPFSNFEDLFLKRKTQLNSQEQNINNKILKMIPNIQISKFSCVGAEDESKIITESGVPFTINLKIKKTEKIENLGFNIGIGPSDKGFVLKGKLNDNEILNSFGKYQYTPIHSHLPYEKFLEWNVLLITKNEIFLNQFSDFKDEKELFYTVTLYENTNVEVFVISNGYFGNDYHEIFNIQVK